MRIRSKLSLFVIPLALLPLLLVGLYAYQSLLKDFDEQVYLDDQQLCLLVATKIERVLEECHDSLILLSSLLTSQTEEQRLQKFGPGVDNPIQEVAQSLAIRYSPYLRIRFLAANGKELFIARGLTKARELASARDEPIFLPAVSVAGQFPPLERRENGSWTTTFSTRLLHDLTLSGFVFLDLDLGSLSKILRETATARPGYYFLFDGSGRVLAEGGEAPLTASNPAYNKYQAALLQARKNPAPNFIHKSFAVAGKRFLISSRPVKEYIAFLEPIPEERWYLAVLRTETPLLSAFYQSQRVFLLIVVSGLAIAIAGAFYISKKITKPISQLATAAGRVAQGDLDLDIAVASCDEIGELAADFNKMAADLKQHIRERQANETLLAVGRFSAALAHDLRNPVEGLKLLSRELCRRVGHNQQEYEIAGAIAQSVDRLSSLINQSLDFARLHQPVFVATDLAGLADEALQDFRFDAVDLKKDYARDLPPVEIDTAQIKRVLANLIRNALEACQSRRTATPCRLDLTLQLVEEKIRLEIADTGPGIPEEIREKIFEPFFSTKPGGHGLGLALARQIISNHAGTITFTSERGQGTRFVIELPIVQGKA